MTVLCRKILFGYYNLVEQSATTITAGDENAQFPASNLKDPRSAKVFRSNLATDSIVFDFASVESVDSIIIRGHMTDGIGFTGNLTIEANPTNVWTSPAFSGTLTPNLQFNMGFSALATAQTYRFWRITGTAGVAFELSDIFIGTVFEPQRNISKQFRVGSDDLSSFSRNRYGQKFGDERPDQRKINGNINLVDKDNFTDMEDFINHVGRINPFWVILDEDANVTDNAFRYSGKYSFNKKPRPQHIIKGFYNYTLTMEEYL